MSQLALVDPDPYLDALEERFGIPRAVFDGYVFFRRSKKRVSIVRREVALPERPEAETVGMPFFRTKSRYPRLTTAAAMKFGHHARQNTLDLDDGEVRELIAAGEIHVSPERSAELEGTGYVLVRHRGFVVTIAFFRAEDGQLVGAITHPLRQIGAAGSQTT